MSADEDMRTLLASVSDADLALRWRAGDETLTAEERLTARIVRRQTAAHAERLAGKWSL